MNNWPGQQGSAYPSSYPVYPQPGMTMPTHDPYAATYPPYPTAYPPSYGQQTYPTAPAYPLQHPQQQPSYPATSYPAPNHQTAGYPPQSVYPPQGYPPPHQQQHLPQQGYPQSAFPAHPSQTPAYPPQGASGHFPLQQGYPSQGYPTQQQLPQHGYQPSGVTQPTMAGGMVTVTFPPDVPTICPKQGFDAEADCKVLHKAMKGLGTDEKAIIEVLTSRTLGQRLQLLTIYKTMYGKDLISHLKSELSGNLEDVVIAMLQPPEIYDATTINHAIRGLGTNEDELIEVIFTRTNAELHNIKCAYKHLFKEDLEHAVAGDTSGYFKRILVACLTGARQEGNQVDLAKAQADANALHAAGPKKWGTDESTFISIFALRSFAHLKVTFDEYKRMTNTDIEAVIKSEMSGDLENSFLAIAKVVKNKHAYFAERLYKSMAGAGTRDKQLIRVVVTRAEKDLGSIKQEFSRMYGKTLDSFISGDCSGDYKKMLLLIVNHVYGSR